MTICEYINERNETMRIEYIPDNKIAVMQSHGYSIMYGLKYSQISKKFPELTPQEVSQRVNTFIKAYYLEQHNGK